MDYAETLRWTGRYFGLWLLALILGGAVATVGVALGGLVSIGAYGLTPYSIRIAVYPRGGLAVIGLGILVFKVGSTAALIHVVVNATEERLPAALDTETMKSDILSVLDERLAEMHSDLNETKRLMGQSAGADDEFEFQ